MRVYVRVWNERVQDKRQGKGGGLREGESERVPPKTKKTRRSIFFPISMELLLAWQALLSGLLCLHRDTRSPVF